MAVAHRVLTRVQDQDDVSVTLGADVDGYGLVYDHATAKFGTPFAATGLRMAADVVPESFTVPLGYTAIYSDMAVPDAVTVEVVGLLIDPGWSTGLAATTVTLVSPYVARSHMYKGQLHCHSTSSDGDLAPTAVVTAYRDAGYDFVTISDHDAITADPAVAGIVYIPAVEETLTEGNHLLVFGATAAQATAAAQVTIDGAEAAGALTFFSHPNMLDPTATALLLAASTRYTGIEIANLFVESSWSVGYAEDQWDALLSAGHQVIGTVVDDCHYYTTDFNQGWVQVYANACTANEIIAALQQGNFYGSTGATLSIAVASGTIVVTTPLASTIEFITLGGTVAQITTAATAALYTVQAGDGYVRVRVTRTADGLQAWTNPIYVS